MTRHTFGLTLAAALSFGMLMPAPAQAAGTEVSGGAPQQSAAPAPVAPVSVKKAAVPSVAPKAVAAGDDTLVAELPATRTKSYGMVGVTWSEATTERDITVQIRSLVKGSWTGWESVEAEDEDPGSGGRPGSEPIWVGKAEGVAVRVSSASGVKPADIQVVTIDAGAAPSTDDGSANTVSGPATSISATPAMATTTLAARAPSHPQPKIISRSAWGASAGGTCSSPTTGPSTRGVVVHHSAGTNSYSKSESASIVRSAQAYHVKGHGWCDIGYNFLVDKYGQIFEGRKGGITKTVRAAHSGNNEVNTNTMGVSMMGNFDTAEPSPALKDSMVKLVGWRMGNSGLKAKGTFKVKERSLTLNMISGHRDVVSTACPGKYGYAWLSAKGGLRDQVEDYLSGSSTPTPTAPGAVTGIKISPTTSGGTVTWSETKGAETYGMCLSSSKASTTCVKSLSGITTTKQVLSGLEPTGGTDYYVQVRAGDGSVAGEWSTKVGFNLSASAPSPVTGVAVSPSTSGGTVTWAETKGAETYGVCLSSSKASTTCVKTYSDVAATKQVLSGLEPTGGTDYYVQVRGTDGNVAGEWSTKLGFNLKSSSSASNAVATKPVAAGTNNRSVPSSGVIALTGHGYGHGIGMSQYGAQNAAGMGKSDEEILRYYYPGTATKTLKTSMRVLLSADTTVSVIVRPRSGLVFRNVATQKALTLPTASGGKTVSEWRISPRSGKPTVSQLQAHTSAGWATYKSTEWTGDGQFEASGPIALVLPSGSATYRGDVRSALPAKGSSTRDTVNVVSMEDYLRGVVPAEMPASWRGAALRAQSVAARTYAARALTTSRHYDICDTMACQEYRGAGGEAASTDAAIKATAGEIVTYDGKPAFTQFSSSSGGWSAVGNGPYLKQKKDVYDSWSGNPNHTWKATVKASTLQRAYPEIGTLKSLTVTKRTGDGDWGGRVTTLTLKGSTSSTSIAGTTARTVLGLKSSWFTFS